jgi:hypothetical protein
VFYRFADFILESDVRLSALPGAERGPGDCRVRMGPPGRQGSEPARWDHHWRSSDGDVVLSCAREGETYRLGFPGLATFLVDEGGAISCRPEPRLPAGTLEHLLIDQVLPRVLTHRGCLVLHAGCVASPHGAVAFLGDSGSGKSTLCAEFARAGHPLLGDDGIVVRPTNAAGFEAMATYPGLRLLPDPLARLFDEATWASPVAHYTAKRRLDRRSPDVTLAAGALPLQALYLLDKGAAVTIDPLSDRDAFIVLLRASFQLHLDDRERSRGLFERIGGLQDAVPVRRLSYPRDFASLGTVREAVLADVEEVAHPMVAASLLIASR